MRSHVLLVCGAVLAVTLSHGGSSQSAFRGFPSSIQIGQNSRHSKYSRQRQEGELDLEGKTKLSIGIVLPHSTFRKRRYESAITTAIMNMKRHSELQEVMQKYHFTSREVIMSNMFASSSPTKILHTLCEEFLPRNVSAILYLFNSEYYGRSTASVQYFFQLAGYLGIPVIAWNADNSGLERDQRTSSPQLQLAPSIEHQAAAMLSILQRYSWPKFAVVTSLIAGHNDFIQALRDLVLELPEKGSGQEFTITNTIRVSDPETDLMELVSSEARILFLYSTRSEAAAIMDKATQLGLTGKNYLWIVTQSVIQSRTEAPPEFPVGMLGVHFDTGNDAMIEEIKTAMQVFIWGLADHVRDEGTRGVLPDLAPHLSCDTGDARWRGGEKFYRFLKNVSIDLQDDPSSPNLEFNSDGTRRTVELKIMNLRPDMSKKFAWEE
ncbi:glutamate receptor ionotropic, NMDA 2B-like, partial [Penaeus japonicus]|uniref:glutamate receptor ionotropic, NMDA 2B-like n=1 Tax=Penaeus japonicus TaxID=27405 RepID=UPI001C717A3F